MLLVPLTISWMIGIIAADLLPLTTALLMKIAVGAFGGILLGWRSRRMQLICGCLLCATLGGLRYEAARVPTTPASVWLLAGRGNVVIQGDILAEPRHTEEGQQVILQTHLAGHNEHVEGRLLLNLPSYPAYHYGQQIRVLGRIKEPQAAERPGDFDYRAYLARQGIFALMQEPLVEVLPGKAGNSLLRSLATLRSHCQAILLRILPEPQSSLAGGILLGLKTAIPKEVMSTFAATGTAHILVVSGWHLSVVALMLASFTTHLRLHPVIAFSVLLAIIWMYALFVGATATVLRAAIMASLTLLARLSGRQSEPWTLLVVACAGLTVFDPQTLWDIGFQLSVLATASLFAFAQPIEQWLMGCPPLRWPGMGWVRAALTATLSAQILALPIIMYYFGSVSLVAPVANILLAPVVPIAMLLGALALFGGLIWLKLGQIMAMGAWLAFTWLAQVTGLLSSLPWAEIRLPAFPLWLLLAYYALMGWYVVGSRC